MKGRAEEPKASFYKFRQEEFSDEEIEREFQELQFVLDQEVEQGKRTDLVKGLNLKRSVLVLMINFFQQACGQAFTSQYGAVFIKQLSTINPFDMTIVLSVVNLTAIMCALSLVDRIGSAVCIDFLPSPLEISSCLTGLLI